MMDTRDACVSGGNLQKWYGGAEGISCRWIEICILNVVWAVFVVKAWVHLISRAEVFLLIVRSSEVGFRLQFHWSATRGAGRSGVVLFMRCNVSDTFSFPPSHDSNPKLWSKYMKRCKHLVFMILFLGPIFWPKCSRKLKSITESFSDANLFIFQLQSNSLERGSVLHSDHFVNAFSCHCNVM